MAYGYDRDTDEQIEEEEDEPRRWGSFVAAVAALAVIGIVSAFGWRAYGATPYPSFSFGWMSADSAAEKADLVELRAFQQQAVGQLQTSAQLLSAQQAEIKQLTEQVTALTAKIDAVRALSAQAAIPPSSHAASSRPPKPKTPAAAKPAARISTGGAPLPPPLQLMQ